MRTSRWIQTGVLALLVTSISLTALFAQDAGETIIKRDPIDHDFYGAGQTVQLIGPVNGDAVIAGQRLTIDGQVAQDVMAAGEVVTINGDVLDDIRAAGRLVTINGAVGDHIVAAGETVTLNASASVGNWAWLAGNQVEVFGRIGTALKAAGETIIIAGVINGPVELTAEHVKILADAVITGPIRVQSPNPPEIASGATIQGDVKHLPMPEVEAPQVLKAVLLAGLMTALSLIITGIVYYLLFPRFSLASARRIEQVPLASLGLGFAVLILTPVVIVILFSLGVTFMLGLLLLAAYLLMLVSGGLTGVVYVSDVALRRLFKKESAGKGMMMLTLIGAFVVLGLVQLIPLLGSLVVFVLMVMGIGALKYQFWQQYRAA
ncbi:MAG: hypothetical protein PVG13_10475 [Thiohalophilus sp.]